jgi:hypothetical protein
VAGRLEADTEREVRAGTLEEELGEQGNWRRSGGGGALEEELGEKSHRRGRMDEHRRRSVLFSSRCSLFSSFFP